MEEVQRNVNVFPDVKYVILCSRRMSLVSSALTLNCQLKNGATFIGSEANIKTAHKGQNKNRENKVQACWAKGRTTIQNHYKRIESINLNKMRV